MSNIDKILGLIILESKREQHSDKVACLHSVLMRVNMAVGKRMEVMRNDERN